MKPFDKTKLKNKAAFDYFFRSVYNKFVLKNNYEKEKTL